MSHYVMAASPAFIECRCGHVSVSLPGHDAHLAEVGEYVENPGDPTQDVTFQPGNWTGTCMSGLISSHAACGVCGDDWHEGPC